MELPVLLLFLPVLQLAADAENEDNISEQKRQNGKRVRYGEVIQVRQSVYLDDVVTSLCASVVTVSKYCKQVQRQFCTVVMSCTSVKRTEQRLDRQLADAK